MCGAFHLHYWNFNKTDRNSKYFFKHFFLVHSFLQQCSSTCEFFYVCEYKKNCHNRFIIENDVKFFLFLKKDLLTCVFSLISYSFQQIRRRRILNRCFTLPLTGSTTIGPYWNLWYQPEILCFRERKIANLLKFSQLKPIYRL